MTKVLKVEAEAEGHHQHTSHCMPPTASVCLLTSLLSSSILGVMLGITLHNSEKKMSMLKRHFNDVLYRVSAISRRRLGNSNIRERKRLVQGSLLKKCLSHTSASSVTGTNVEVITDDYIKS